MKMGIGKPPPDPSLLNYIFEGESIVEVAPNIHRLEVPLGNRFVCVFLLVGSEGVLVLDTGMDDTPAQHIAPYLKELDIPAERIRYVINSHADIDHTGGNMSLREIAPKAIFMCHKLDRSMVEDLELMIAARYSQFAADHDIDDSQETKDWMRANARHSPIDLGLSGGETVHLGNGWHVEILFTPGHTRGHITVYEPRSQTALIADAALWNSILTEDGRPAFPPTYRYVDTYIGSIQMLQSLPVDILLTGHYPVYRDETVVEFLSESRAYVDRVDRALAELLRSKKESYTLRELIAALKAKLGDWPDGAEVLLDFPLAGHLERLVQYRIVRTGRRDKLLTYTWAE
jgi:glyoxylase-like metal-dependent hydrolase (beta-lactamase superfamily II)